MLKAAPPSHKIKQVVAALARAPSAQLDAPDLQGRTALHLAAARGHSGPVTELWARGATIDTCDLHGWTALHYASRAGHTEVALQLVIAGSLVSASDPHGITAAHLAAERGFAGRMGGLDGGCGLGLLCRQGSLCSELGSAGMCCAMPCWFLLVPACSHPASLHVIICWSSCLTTLSALPCP